MKHIVVKTMALMVTIKIRNYFENNEILTKKQYFKMEEEIMKKLNCERKSKE